MSIPTLVSDFIVIDRGGPGLHYEEVRLVEPVVIQAEDLVAGG